VNHQRDVAHKRERRRHRVRKNTRSRADRPRLAVFRSLQHVYAQIIDDVAGATLVSASSMDGGLGDLKYGGNKAAAAAVGKALAQKAIAKGISQVAFDRREYKYHGRVAALADAAREAGLKF
jgi:large subunit ribosomal protein L18